MNQTTADSNLGAEHQADTAEVAASLAARIHAGDLAAENELARRYRSGLVVLLRHWTGDRTLAEDLAHEVFMVVIARLRDRQLDEPTKLVAFLRGTAHNMAIATERREVRRRTNVVGDAINDFEDAGADPHNAVSRDQEVALVKQLIAELGVARDRELLYRHYIAGESKAWICEVLELDSVHFNRVLHRARQRLCALLPKPALRPVR